MHLCDLADDRQTESRTRLRAGRGGAVEAVEHERALVGRDPDAAVAHFDDPTAHVDLDRCVVRAELARVVDEVVHGAIDGRGADVDHRGRVARQGDRAPAPSALAFHDARHEVDQIDVLHGFIRARVGREVDELGDEITQLLELDLRGVDQLRPLRLVEGSRALEQFDVRAQRREGRPQLVARVHDEPLLLSARRSERGEHRVEAAREPPELVVPPDLDAVPELLGLRDLLGCDRELFDGADDAPRDQPGGRGRDRRSGERDEQEPEVEGGEHVVRVGDAARDLRRAAVARRHGEHAVFRAGDRHGTETGCSAVRGDRLVGRVDRDGGLVRDRAHDRALRVEQLDDCVGLGQRLPAVGLAVPGQAGTAVAGSGSVVAEPGRDDGIVRALGQEPIGLGAQLALRTDVGGVDAADDDHRERGRDDEQ